jgi:hypothetical protein
MPRQILQQQSQLHAIHEQVKLQKVNLLTGISRSHQIIHQLQQQIKSVASNVWPSANRSFVCAELWQNQWQYALQQTKSLADLKQQLNVTEANLEQQNSQLRQLLTKETVLVEQQQLLSCQLVQKVVAAQELQLSELSRKR